LAHSYFVPKKRVSLGRERRESLATQISVQAQADPAFPGETAGIADLGAPPHPRLRFHPRFHSQFLPDDRDVTVYLPPGYDEADGDGYEEAAPLRYPVLFLHDGQNLFDPRTSFVPGRTWQVAETADAMIESGQVEPLIIVGVANTGERRLAEYTPTRDWKMGGGEADKYGKLLIQELLPFIASRYRLLSGPENIGLGGSSLGGLVSLYLGLGHADVFGRLAVMSPSVWWNHKSILGYVNEAASQIAHRPRIWLDVGDSEGRRTAQDAELLDRRLLANGWRAGNDLHYEHVPGGTHDEASWAQRVGPMLRFLFPKN
jgi:predicted alpha/beta superfamily hydrolase